MSKFKAYKTILWVLFFLLLFLSFLNGLVLFSEPVTPVAPGIVDTVYRVIVFFIWMVVSGILAARLTSKEAIVLLAALSWSLSFLHMAGGYYLLSKPLERILKIDSLFYPAMEFIFGLINGFHILLYLFKKKKHNNSHKDATRTGE